MIEIKNSLGVDLEPCPLCKGPVEFTAFMMPSNIGIVCNKCMLVLLPAFGRPVSSLIETWNRREKEA